MVDWPVKIDVDTKVSKKTTKKLADTLMDIVSPISQSLGLAGDYIAHRRKVLSVIFQQGFEAAQRSKQVITPPPAKFLLEFADKASREALKSKLIELWANLFSRACTDYDDTLNTYLQILSQISPLEASLIKKLCIEAAELRSKSIIVDYRTVWEDEISKSLLSYPTSLRDADKFGTDLFAKKFEVPERIIFARIPYYSGPTEISRFLLVDDKYNAHRTNYDALHRQNLLQMSTHDLYYAFDETRSCPLTLGVIRATSLGVAFVQCCEGL